MTRIAVLDDYQGVALRSADWSSVFDRAAVHAFTDHMATDAELVAALADFDIVVAMRERTPFPRSLLAKLPSLKLLVTTGPGNASIDVAAARELGISVCGTRAPVPPNMEHTWALILACAKRLVEFDRDIRSGGWQRHVALDLAGARLGVIGLGNYGSRVAAVAKLFEMDVVAWSPNLTEDRCEQVGVRWATKEELLATSDFVTIHLKLSDRSRNAIGQDDLRAMQPSAYLVNTSRGPIVDEEALVRALKDGWIAGAALDVFDVEPLPLDHPFRGLPNVVLTPHVGYVTQRSYRVFFEDAVEDILAHLDGSELRPVPPIPPGR
jgi:phosphoglycerate dehydrogenase-like enzyme